MQKEKIGMKNKKTLRLLLGDQLNSKHSWFATTDASVQYVLMEIKSETNYALHHLQKIIGFFGAMQSFAKKLQALGHQVIYIHLNDPNNLHCFDKNISTNNKKYFLIG
jgi:deoxyribodipyrimidine photolyase-related protein